MRLLLDTHIAVWAVLGDRRLPAHAASLIENSEQAFVSAASLWEIAIKRSRSRETPYDFELSADQSLAAFREAGFRTLNITPIHAAAVGHLPPVHRDPFDRLLAAQAITEPLRLVTSDKVLEAYSDTVILV